MKKLILITLILSSLKINSAVDVLDVYDKVLNHLKLIKSLSGVIKPLLNEQQKDKFVKLSNKVDYMENNLRQLRAVIRDVQVHIINRVDQFEKEANEIGRKFSCLPSNPDEKCISKSLKAISDFLKSITGHALQPMVEFLNMPAFNKVEKITKLRDDLEKKFIERIRESLEFMDSLAVILYPNILIEEPEKGQEATAIDVLATESLAAEEPLKIRDPDNSVKLDPTPKETFKLDVQELDDLGLDFEAD